MEMPNDPFILMSYLNTQLRDHYDSFAELCKSAGADAAEIEEKMKTIGYYYCAEQNQFRPGKITQKKGVAGNSGHALIAFFNFCSADPNTP